ncbi:MULTISPECIES: FAD/NAD(P)-binding oxidoreductase [unclassified Enterococcus]|uniref:NAD(P)/FAD-dependent oxidoreductase n=1 Tax=unclassified Enterococcus TaxID=2608891 RepID=UPI0013EE3CD3|nr:MULTISPECIES: FAD/NAD(P)-binding oxidoreductase [unclassified Enterococcus]
MKIVIIGASHGGIAAADSLLKLDSTDEVYLIDGKKREEAGYISSGLTMYLNRTISELNEVTTDLHPLLEKGLILLTEHEVCAIAPEQHQITLVAANGVSKQLAYDKLIIATGSSSEKNTLLEGENVLVYKGLDESRQALSYLENAKDITIFGAGYIGTELANSLADKGCTIHLIDHMPNILSRYFDGEMIREVEDQLASKGIVFHPNELLIDHKKEGDRLTEIRILSQSIKTDLVIFPSQAHPNTSILREKVELYEDETVVVDEYLQTSDPDIYAIGDIVPITYPSNDLHLFMPLITRAVHMARAVALTISGQPTVFDRSKRLTATRIAGYFLGTAGLTEDEAPFLGKQVRSYTGIFQLYPAYRSLDTTVKAKLIYCPETMEILGGQLISTEFLLSDLDLLASFIERKMTISQLAVDSFGFMPAYTPKFHYFNELAFQIIHDR